MHLSKKDPRPDCRLRFPSLSVASLVARLTIGVDTLRSLFAAALSRPAAGSSQFSGVIVCQRALQCVANIQGVLVLAKSGLSDAEITELRDSMIAAALEGEK